MRGFLQSKERVGQTRPVVSKAASASHGSRQSAANTTDGHHHQASFHDLPPEIHLAISRYLIYPDALSLKHTCRYLYLLVDTGVRLKIDWLIERRSLHLECPNDRRCDLGSDLKFCRGSVRLLMQRRREHLECESRPGLGCLVYGTPACTHRRRLSERWKQWLRATLTVEVWWIVVAVGVVLVAWCLSPLILAT
ncbi:uncharacterized protein B0I36DRAFT_363164 [Microdochium trichocladiopsis]|uniref:F-box domain-containing protein n=1 Tax=Microdochium trichocladiopsis TaxID=1682393 RepID=A0A9P8Y9M7_9PEZI|nr:uncharacterized protein B0I36DRAFT_363164 [Microdochium trichocladiopsis]KAH7031476.1 hypothetical protein B0I36DRAFT_363164 [Microdochium trichocladiopsis]